MKVIKNLFKIHRFDYQVWSNGKLIGDAENVHIGGMRTDFSMYLDQLALREDSGDGYTIMVTKR